MAVELEKLATWNAFKRCKSNNQKACKVYRPHTYIAYNGVRVTDKPHRYDIEYLEQTCKHIADRQKAEL